MLIWQTWTENRDIYVQFVNLYNKLQNLGHWHIWLLDYIIIRKEEIAFKVVIFFFSVVLYGFSVLYGFFPPPCLQQNSSERLVLL